MAKKEYGVYLKDGRFIRLFGGACATGTGAMPDITMYINESFGDDFIPDLQKVGDVQYFASGAKMKLVEWGYNREYYIKHNCKTMSNAVIELYGNNGGYIGKLNLLGASNSNTAYEKVDFVVGINNYYHIFNTNSYPSGFNYVYGYGYLGHGNTFDYKFSDGWSARIYDIENTLNGGTYNKGVWAQWVLRSPSRPLQPKVNTPFLYSSYMDRYKITQDGIAVGTVGEWKETVSNFYKFLGEVGLATRYIGEDLGDKSSVGGQDGTYTDTTDVINVPSIPNVNASSCGLVKMYELTVPQASALSNYLWSAPTEVIENLKKLMVKPMDSIISLQLSPINPPLGESGNIYIGGMDSGVQGTEITNQYLQLDCGTVEINKYWGNCLDFSPYTKASIYLPMIGTQLLNVDDIMGKTVGVIYNMDLLSGSVVAFITANGNTLYSYQGVMNSQIPLTGADNAGLVSSTIGLVASGAVAFASGGASVPLTATVASGLSVMNSKQNIQRGGNVGASGGLLAVKYPYITLERAVQSLPNNFKHYKGYTSNITSTIGMCKGYTEISYIDLSGIGALKEEIEMLNDALKDGFYA